MNETEQSRRFNQYLDQWLAAGAPPEAPDGMADLAATAGRLFALADQMPQPDAALQQRLRRQMRQTLPRRAGLGSALAGLRLRWLAPVAAVALLALLVLPGPRAALGNWMASFHLGGVEVVVAPEPTVRAALTDQQQAYPSLADAQRATGLALAAPGYLPAGYQPASVTAVSFQELPRWLQPLFVESRFEAGADAPPGSYILLRQYNAARSDQARLGEVEYQSADVDEVQELTLAGDVPAVLLVLGQSDQPLHELIWQQDDVTFELWSNALPVDELRRVAESLRP